MGNTIQENQLAVSAFKQISAKYAAYFNMNPSVKGFAEAMVSGQNVEVFVKFKDNKPFMSNLSIGGSKKQGSNCAVCGFTAPVTGNKYNREMYINRQFANASTVVHEMLHFLTHPQFWMYVSAQITESVTEYFTRKVVKAATDTSFDISQRSGRYDLQHQFLSIGRDDIKKRITAGKITPGKGYMKRAYFQGDQQAISFILTEFKDIEELFAEEDR